MKRKLSNKIIIGYSALIVFLLTSLFIFFNHMVRDTHLNIIKREMSEKLQFIDYIVKNNRNLLKPNQEKNFYQSIAEKIRLRITIINKFGKVLVDTEYEDVNEMDNHIFRTEVKKAFASGYGESLRYSNTLRTEMLYSAIRSGEFVVRLAKPLVEIEDNLWKLRKLIITFSCIILLIAVVSIVIISNTITKPINETLNFTEQFSNGNYSKRILNYSNDEIGAVQRALNRMADTIVEKIESLIFEQKKLHVTLESISDAIVVIDNEKRILIANKAFNLFFNIDTFTTGRLYYEVIRSRSLNKRIEKALTKGDSSHFEERLLSGKVCDININTIKEEKTIQGILLVFRDITEKKKIEQMKTDLVANMSHELKTPIAIMKGYLETVYENIENVETSKDFIQKAISNADRQSSLIDDILKLNMLESVSEFDTEKIEIREVITNCVELLKSKADQKQVAITLDLDNLHISALLNRFLVEEIFFNLIDNAINYNVESGTIDISSKDTGSHMVVTIKDSGIGIPQDSIDRIFERFYRVDKSRSRSTGGTGLGLSIVKHAAELLHWKISVQSGPNGTTFFIQL